LSVIEKEIKEEKVYTKRVQLDVENPVFHEGQEAVWRDYKAGKRVMLMCSGTGGGKSSFGSIWTENVVAKHKNEACNFIVATPTYKIMTQSTLFALLKVFTSGRGWKLNKNDMVITHNKWKVNILLRTGENPNSCEGVQDCIGGWGDEAGQFSRLFYENFQSRTSFRQAPLLLTTTPYTIGWMVRDLIQPFEKGLRSDVGYVHFTSIENPAFSKEEFERQRGLLSPEAFARRYEGMHAKMQGLVYSSYSEGVNVIEDTAFQGKVRYFGGVDWGYSPDPFAIVIRAVLPDGRHIDVKTYKQTHKVPSEKVQVASALQALYPVEFWICGHDEPGSIQEFNNAGLRAIQCVVGKNSVEERIEKHNELIRTKRYFIFRSSYEDLDDEYNNYYRHPETGTPEGEDHLIDASGMISHYLSTFYVKKHVPTVPGSEKANPRPFSTFTKRQGVKDVWEI
jgi:hypothetical protein